MVGRALRCDVYWNYVGMNNDKKLKCGLKDKEGWGNVPGVHFSYHVQTNVSVEGVLLRH